MLPRRSFRLLLCGCLTAIYLGGVTRSACAQPREERRPFQEAVSLPVDEAAAKQLLTIEDRWAAGRWKEALVDLVTLCEQSGRSLVPTEHSDEAGYARYESVSAASERWLQTLPIADLKLYRQRLDPVAEQWWSNWEAAADPRWLERIVDQAFFSQRGDDALQALGQAAWQRGEFTQARGWWSQLLPADVEFPRAAPRHYPDAARPAADVAAWLVLCDFWSPAPEHAVAALAAYRSEFPEAMTQRNGKSLPWLQFLEQVQRDSARDPEPELPARDCATFGGNAQRSQVAPRDMDLGSEVWSLPLAVTSVPRQSWPALYPLAPPLAYYPAVVQNRVYLNDGTGIWAWNLQTGEPAWPTDAERGGRIHPLLAPDALLEPRRPVAGTPLRTVTVGNGRLYAVLGSVVTTPAPMELREQLSELVALDIAAGQGRLLWTLPHTELTARINSGDNDAPPWMWEGTPVLVGTRLYAALSRRRPQLEWCVVCLDAETGLLLWQTAAGMSRPAPPDHENLSSQLLLTAGDGLVSLATHWGAIVAFDARDGRLRWGLNYRSQLPEPSGRTPQVPAPPPVLIDGTLLVAPLDTPNVLAIEARTGRLLWQQPLKDTIGYVLGAINGHAIVSGRHLWGLELETGRVRWQVSSAEPERQGYGRGWLTPHAIYWPTRESILVVDPATGNWLREQPLATPWSRRFGGHLVAGDGVLLVTGSDRITAYGEYGASQPPPIPPPIPLLSRR